MDDRWSRRSVVGAIGAAGVGAMLAARPGRVAAGVQGAMHDPQGIGLTRAEIEGIYGPGMPGQAFLVYADRFLGAGLHIGFSESGIAEYIYTDFEGMGDTGMGVLVADAGMLLNGLLPADVRAREGWVAPETPGTLVMVRNQRWTSRSLGQVLDGRRSILTSTWTLPGMGPEGDLMSRLTIAVETRF